VLNRDFREILSAFSDAQVEYLLVGAYALAAHGLVRATGDIDLWIRATPENAERVSRAVIAFGAPSDCFRISDFVEPEMIVQLGVSPVRVDILTSISGVEFDDAWADRIELELEGIRVPVISRMHLIANKRAADRDQDRVDLKFLERESQ
jgi:predicted nucleotidyltransferase